MDPAANACEVGARYARVCGRIEAALRRAGRPPDTVTLVAVAKTFSPTAVRAAIAAGARDIGESYVQEAGRKIEALAPEVGGLAQPLVRWHFVGHLQRNKAKRAVALFHAIHSLDSILLAEHLDRAAAPSGQPVRVFVEVNISGERTKRGIERHRTFDFLTTLAALSHLHVVGFMTVPPPAPDPEASRPYFRALATLRDEMASRGFDLPHLSMGMTADYEVAIEEGATVVRVGRAIFGERPEPGATGTSLRPPDRTRR